MTSMLARPTFTEKKSEIQSSWRAVAKNVLTELNVKLAPEWEEPFYSGERIILCLGGEGSGKSFMAGLYGTARSVYDLTWTTTPGLYWVIGQDFEDARYDFDQVVNFQEQLGNVDKLNISSHRDQQVTLLTKTGQTFRTYSAYDFAKIAREEPDGVLGAEFTRWQSYEAFQRCEGRLMRKYPNSWGFFTGSFESSLGWVPDSYKLGQGPNTRDIRSWSIPTWANIFKYPGGVDDPAIIMARASMSEDRFMERFGGRPAPAKSIIFHEFRNHLHVDDLLKVDKEFPVYLAIDPGDAVYAVLFVQLIEGEVRVLDELYVTHWTHQQVTSAVMSNSLWPHVVGGAIDRAAKQAHMGMPRPISEWYKDTHKPLVQQYQTVEDTIELVRVALSYNPLTARARMRIHPNCKGLISEMGGGPSPLKDGGPWLRYEGKGGLGPPRPDHNDACKALGYLLGQKQALLQPKGSGAKSASYLEKDRWQGDELLGR